MKRIQDIEKNDRPREKLKRYGLSKVSDEELLAILLGSGTKGMNVKSLAKAILKKIRHVKMSSVSEDDLRGIRGLGEIKRQQVIALLSLAGRLYEQSRKDVLSGKDVWHMCSDFYGSRQEHLAVFYLDARSCLIERRIVFIGTLNESIAHPRDIFEPALRTNAAALIVAHNHPSGTLDPSDADIALTNRLVEAGKMLGITVRDHVIVTPNEYLSMRDNGIADF